MMIHWRREAKPGLCCCQQSLLKGRYFVDIPEVSHGVQHEEHSGQQCQIAKAKGVVEEVHMEHVEIAAEDTGEVANGSFAT